MESPMSHLGRRIPHQGAKREMAGMGDMSGSKGEMLHTRTQIGLWGGRRVTEEIAESIPWREPTCANPRTANSTEKDNASLREVTEEAVLPSAARRAPDPPSTFARAV